MKHQSLFTETKLNKYLLRGIQKRLWYVLRFTRLVFLDI